MDVKKINDNEYIKKIASEINDYTNNYVGIEKIAQKLNIASIASPFINFRDSLNHYKMMCDEYLENPEDESKIFGQIACIQEHLSRGVRDAIISISLIIEKRIAYNLNDYKKNKEIQNELKRNIHQIKNLILHIRSISEIRNERDYTEAIKLLYAIIKQTDEIFNKNHISNIIYHKIPVNYNTTI